MSANAVCLLSSYQIQQPNHDVQEPAQHSESREQSERMGLQGEGVGGEGDGGVGVGGVGVGGVGEGGVGVGGEGSKPPPSDSLTVFSIKLGEPRPRLLTTPETASFRIACQTCA